MVPRSQTLYVNLQKLRKAPASGLVVGLMMATNDIILANDSFGHYAEELKGTTAHKRVGVCRYFIFLQCSHLNEAIPLIMRMTKDLRLASFIRRSEETYRAFGKVLRYARPGPEKRKFEAYVKPIRNKLVFHYDTQQLGRALIDRSSRSVASIGTVTVGNDNKYWRFNVADDLVDSAVCRHLWRIPRNSDLRQEADAIIDFCHAVSVDVIGFASHFLVRYVREYALL